MSKAKKNVLINKQIGKRSGKKGTKVAGATMSPGLNRTLKACIPSNDNVAIRAGVVPTKLDTIKLGVPSITKNTMLRAAGLSRKAITVQTPLAGSRNATHRLIASMNLDEMLEASEIGEIGLRGEKVSQAQISKEQSPKVRIYAGAISKFCRKDSSKSIAKKMQQDLTAQIVEKNRKTTNAVEADRLYHALMNDCL